MFAMGVKRSGRVPMFLAAASFAIALGVGAPCAATSRAVGGGHAGRSRGARRLGTARGPFASSPFDDPFARTPFDDRAAHGRRHHFSDFVNGVPYGDWYWYDEDWGYDAREEAGPRRRGYHHSGYCDVAPHTFPQNCVWKEGP
jgi:hypothetical protein